MLVVESAMNEAVGRHGAKWENPNRRKVFSFIFPIQERPGCPHGCPSAGAQQVKAQDKVLGAIGFEYESRKDDTQAA
jgi:hypothetical protein